MIIYNYHPVTKEFLSQCEADESPLEPGVYLIPANATDMAPPTEGDNQKAVFDNGAWSLKDDYRRHTACEIDSSGFFVGTHEFVLGEKPTGFIILASHPSAELYKPMWQKGGWVQGETMPPQPPSVEDRVKALEDAMLMKLGL